MRISTAQFYEKSIDLMQRQAAQLARTQEQLATGKRLQRPSDDPLAITQLMPLKDTVSIHNQYERNAGAAEYRLELEEIQLEHFGNILIRLKELAIQANNDTLNASDRDTIAQEVRQNLQNMLAIANTKDSNGDYIFAGDNVRTAPILENPPGTFTYTGDQGIRNIQIGTTRQIASSDPGSDIFVNVAYSGGGTQDIFTTIHNFATALEANNPSSIILDDIQAGFENVLTTRTKIGARLNAIQTKREDNDGRILRSEMAIARLEDLDFAEAVGRLSLQLTSLQASQQAFGRIQNLSLFNHI